MPISDAPDRIRSSTEHPEIEYERAKDLIAVHGLAPAATDLDAALLLEGGTTRVYRENAGRGQVGIVGPVYRQVQGDPMIVPSGRVLVRLREGIDAAEMRREFEHAGYEIDQILTYAPNAAWLTSVSGDIGEALRKVDDLETIDAVVNVEPQVLRAAVLRKGGVMRDPEPLAPPGESGDISRRKPA